MTRTTLPALIAEQPSFSRGGSEPHVRKATVIEAQVAGQHGARRGLRGGQPVLDAARSAYLSAEWRGADDRRVQAGTFRRVAV
jgi:hypothetical protein